MPYIKQECRDELLSRAPTTPGELNYILTCICNDYMRDRGEERYYVYNEVMGALECAKFELYRRLIAPYEDASMEKNGDVYNARLEERS